MAGPLFEDFLNDDDVYDECVRFWEDLIERIAASYGQAREWRPWLPRTFANGTALIARDLRPIFDARSDLIDRAFRISQHLPVAGETQLPIGAWLETYGDEWDADMPSEEMFLDLVLTEMTAVIAERLLSFWMNPETTLESMREFIRDSIPSKDSGDESQDM